MNDNASTEAPAIIERMYRLRDLTKGIKENILSGEVDSLDAMIALKGIKKSIETIEKDADVADSVMRRFDHYNEKTVNLRHASITLKDTGVKYDYSVCNDPAYNALMAEMNELKAKIKEREDFLKALPDAGLDVYDHDTGELYTLHKPLRLATQTLEYKFKK